MRLINVDYDDVITPDKPMVIYAFADTHLGNAGFNKELLAKHIDMCKKENAYWVHLGDWVEAVTPDDKRYDVRVRANPVLDQYDEITEMFYPIRDRGIAILSGNHDEKLSKRYGDYVSKISRDLGVPYLGYMGFINIRLFINAERLRNKKRPQKQVVMFLHHGHGGGAMLGSKGNNLQKMSGKFEADIYGIGHIHTYMSHIDSVLGLRFNHRNKKRFGYKKRHYFACPAYFNAYEDSDIPNYAERAAFQPQTQGCVRLEINTIKINKNWEITVKTEPILG